MRFKLLIVKYFLQLRLQRILLQHSRKLPLWQGRKLLQHLENVARRSPFYREIQEKKEALPLMNKSSYMDAFDQINMAGIRKEEALRVAMEAERSRDFSPTIGKITVGLSSGTSGNRGVFLVSEDERARWVGAMLDRVLGWSFRKRRLAFFLRANSNLYESGRSSLLEFGFFDLLLPIQVHIERLRSFQPHILVAPASVLLKIAEACKAGSLSLDCHKIISVAEVLEEADKAYMEAIWGQKIHQVYQCTEGFLGYTCAEGTLHLNEDMVIFEKKEIEGGRFHPVIYDFTRMTQPMLRYELNDLLHPRPDPCPCGSVFMAIDRIEGRSDDCFLMDTAEGQRITLFPDVLRHVVLGADSRFRSYLMEQTSASEIHLWIDVEAQQFESSCEQLRRALDAFFQEQHIREIRYTFTLGLPELKDQKLRRIKRSYHA
ncbi:MAG: adenylate synthase [Bacteroidetes bacterium]|nr:MAG: adenylate synthase [Bacteroidota bacterium]